jgi:endonuclease/exonuclease/phosphatase family metal-dependent hydrolase
MQRLRIATLNIWNKSGPWPRRLGLIREELARLRPDVIGLQEVLRLGTSDGPESDQASEIADGFGYQIAFGSAADYASGLQFGNAVLSRHPIVAEQNFALPGAESGETRALLYTRISTPFGELPMFVTHLNWKLHHGSVRLAQVRFIAARIFELEPIDESKLPAVLVGDFNADPDSDEIRCLRGLHTVEGKSIYFADAWGYAGDGSGGFTFDRRNRFAALAHEPPRRIDYIFVRGPDRKFRGEPLETRLAFAGMKPDVDGELWPSDHFGVVTELAAEPRAE